MGRNDLLIRTFPSYGNYNSTRIKFEPSDCELNDFFTENQQKIFEYMVFEMNPNKEEIDPFSNSQAVDFYSYHQLLSQFEKRSVGKEYS